MGKFTYTLLSTFAVLALSQTAMAATHSANCQSSGGVWKTHNSDGMMVNSSHDMKGFCFFSAASIAAKTATPNTDKAQRLTAPLGTGGTGNTIVRANINTSRSNKKATVVGPDIMSTSDCDSTIKSCMAEKKIRPTTPKKPTAPTPKQTHKD